MYKGIFMAQNYVVPNIYQDMSNQSQGYFAFRFTCQHCYWQVDTAPIRSNVATATNVMDIGIGMLNGFWGRAAEVGEKMYGSKWHAEQAKALQKSWAEIQHEFHLCPKCHRTVCMRCFNVQLNLCTECAPDLKADGAQFQHKMNVDAQRSQIEQQYQAPQFNVNAIPSAVTPDLMQSGASQAQLPVQSVSQQLTPAAIAGFGTVGYPKEVTCPTCRKVGPPGKFCQDCGTKLPLPELFCPNCSSQVENSTRFCPECGTKMTHAV
jgi:membrane protease subunit (stomatin/prohibitin family)